MTHAIVIGGGATGVGVARDLSLRGVDVTLLERGGLGAGTTGRSHGVLHSGARYAAVDPEGAADCIRENRILREIAGTAVSETGGLFVQLPDDPNDAFERRAAACEELGISVERLDPKTAREREPELPSDVERALAVPDGVVSPGRLVAVTADAARRNGARIRTDTPVTDVLVDGDRVVGVETADGRLRADYVVNATGAWAGEIVSLAGIELRMAPTKGAMVAVSEPDVGSVLNRSRRPSDGDIAVPYRGGVVLGTTSTPVEDPDDVATDGATVERLLGEGEALLPGVAEAPIDRVYCGVRPLYGGDRDGRSAPRGFRLLDHTEEGRSGFLSIVGGKLTTHRLMAEAVSDHVCGVLGIDEPCRTHEIPLPAAEGTRFDELCEQFDVGGPADETFTFR